MGEGALLGQQLPMATATVTASKTSKKRDKGGGLQ